MYKVPVEFMETQLKLLKEFKYIVKITNTKKESLKKLKEINKQIDILENHFCI